MRRIHPLKFSRLTSTTGRFRKPCGLDRRESWGPALPIRRAMERRPRRPASAAGFKASDYRAAAGSNAAAKTAMASFISVATEYRLRWRHLAHCAIETTSGCAGSRLM